MSLNIKICINKKDFSILKLSGFRRKEPNQPNQAIHQKFKTLAWNEEERIYA